MPCDGLRGESIPLGARIVAVADAYSAMMDDRAYRKGRTKEDALGDLQRGAGTQFDPRVVEVFCRIVQHDVLPQVVPQSAAPEYAGVRPAVEAIARSLTQARQAGRAMPAMADVVKRLLRPLDLPAALDEILGEIQEVSPSGQEATISLGSRKYAWRHSRLRGRAGADTWIGFGILTYNLDRMVAIGAKR